MEGRIADFWVRDRALFALLERHKGLWLKVDLPGVPEGAHLLGVFHDWERRSFRVRFAHPSFPLVPDGDVVPIVGELELSVRLDDAACVPVVVEAPDS